MLEFADDCNRRSRRKTALQVAIRVESDAPQKSIPAIEDMNVTWCVIALEPDKIEATAAFARPSGSGSRASLPGQHRRYSIHGMQAIDRLEINFRRLPSLDSLSSTP